MGMGQVPVVKIGWTQLTTDRAAVGSSGEGTGGIARAVRPGVALAVLAGSEE